jgi:hypothetical protein
VTGANRSIQMSSPGGLTSRQDKVCGL